MGGAAGHMMHPFQCPDVKTGNDLLALFEEAKNKVGSVKIDGTNVSFKLVDTPVGGKEFAGDRGSYDRMDVMGLTGDNIGKRWEDPTHGMRSMYGLVVKILNDALNTKNPETGESIIKPELISLGMWDNPSKFINTEYVKGKTNQVAYPDSAKFLALHGINQFYASAPRYPRQNQMARSEEAGYLPMPEEFMSMKRGDRPKSTPIKFDADDLQSLIRKITPFAKKEGFTVVHTIPTEHETDVNLEGIYNKTLSRSVNINLDENRSLNLNLKQWLDKVRNPIESGEFLKVKLSNGRMITALSKLVYQELINNQTPLNQLLAPDSSEQEGELALHGAVIYYATLLLGADLLRSQKAAGEEAQGLFGDEMLNLGSHEGLVILDQDQLPFCGGAQVKFTGEFIEKGQDSPFRQTNENILYEQKENLDIKYVVMIPGGFKPPTAGHHQMIIRYANHPDVKEVIIIQGPKDRDGVTNVESRAIFEIYGGFPNNVKFMVSRKGESTPLQTAYELVKDSNFTNQYEVGTVFSIGASVKGGDDSRVREFVEYFDKRKELLAPDVNIAHPPFVSDVFVRSGIELSASTMRKALAEGDLDTVSLHLPDPSFLDAVLKVLDYDPSQKKTLGEELTLKDLFSLVESAMKDRKNHKLKEQEEMMQQTVPLEAIKENPDEILAQVGNAMSQIMLGVLSSTEYGTALSTTQGTQELQQAIGQHVNRGLIKQILNTLETSVDVTTGMQKEISSMAGGNVQGHSGKRDEETLIREDEDDLIEIIMSRIISGE